MPDKLLSSESSSSPGIVQIRQMNKIRRKTVNVTWLCCAIALIGIVLLGFAFLAKNLIGHWPGESLLRGSSKRNLITDDVPIYPYLSNAHSYDTNIPGEGDIRFKNEERKAAAAGKSAQEEISRPSTIEDRNRDKLYSENDQVKLEFIRRGQWGAHAAKRKLFSTSFALDKVIVMETGTESCLNEEQCSQVVRNLQKIDMKAYSLDDIRYNFLIGGDGSVYEGRGFNAIGEHTPKFNSKSVGVAVIGRFDEVAPTEAQVASLRKLLQFGMAWEHLKSNYELFGYDQLVPDSDQKQPQGPGASTGTGTGSGSTSRKSGNPGTKLFSIIRKWPHWTENNFYKTYQ